MLSKIVGWGKPAVSSLRLLEWLQENDKTDHLGLLHLMSPPVVPSKSNDAVILRTVSRHKTIGEWTLEASNERLEVRSNCCFCYYFLKINRGNYYRASMTFQTVGESQKSWDYLCPKGTCCFVKLHLIGRIWAPWNYGNCNFYLSNLLR